MQIREGEGKRRRGRMGRGRRGRNITMMDLNMACPGWAQMDNFYLSVPLRPSPVVCTRRYSLNSC